MIDIAHPMSIIVHHPTVHDSSSVPADAVSDTETFSPLSEMPSVDLTPSIDVFSSSSNIHRQRSLSSLFLGPPRSSSVRFVDPFVLVLHPCAFTASLSSFLLQNCCQKLEHSLKWRGNRNEIRKEIQQSTTEGGRRGHERTLGW